MIGSVLEASARHRIPLYPETHRATVFQDLWRTVQLVRRFPELRFNGDFSHWYTGLEMVYGGFEKKLEFIQPVLDRVRFLHGRIGTPGCIQVDIGDGDALGRPYVAHFRRSGSQLFQAFSATPPPVTQSASRPNCWHPASTTPGHSEAEKNRIAGNSRWCSDGIARECFQSALKSSG